MKRTILIILTLFLVITALLAGSAAAASDDTDVSPAIACLRRSTKLNKCGVYDEIISFSKADFENTLQTPLKYINVTALPDEEEGVLKLNGVPVVSGQTIAASSLNYLTFTPAEDVVSASFTFRCDAPGWVYTDIPCSIKFFENRNTSPTIASGSFSTVRNAKTEYRINLFEPDGDNVSLYIDQYPASGSITISGDTLIYTPVNGFAGSDKMVIRAVDEYGNSSAAASITITVGKSEIVFSDMTSSSAHAAAIALAENDIVTYVYKDGEYLYNPNLKVSRIDFLVMLMSAADVNAEGFDTNLPFTDTSKLNNGKKQYLAKAVAMKVVDRTQGEFKPNEYITKKDAAIWISKLLGLNGKAAVINDITDFDVESVACITASVDAGIFTAPNGIFSPDTQINREEAARILFKVIGK